MNQLPDIAVTTLDGRHASLGEFLGKASLVVNVASRCGFTPQYRGLEALYRQFKDRGFKVLGFPCDQFGHQEPGDAEEIGRFCTLNYEVSFPMFAKIEVNGAHAHPLFSALKQAAPGVLGSRSIKWNFTKFLVGGDGARVERFAPSTAPERLQDRILALLVAASA